MTPTPDNSTTVPDSPTDAGTGRTLWEDEEGMAFQTLLIVGALVAIAAAVGGFMISRTRDTTDTADSAVGNALAQISDAMALITTT